MRKIRKDDRSSNPLRLSLGGFRNELPQHGVSFGLNRDRMGDSGEKRKMVHHRYLQVEKSRNTRGEWSLMRRDVWKGKKWSI
jgi:hypothetical protein